VTGPRLIVITDLGVAPVRKIEERTRRVAAAAVPGSVVIQLRDRELPVRERLELGKRLVGIAREHQQLFFVNDRIDLALLLDADGVHLGESSVEPEDARSIWGPQKLISRACHDPAAAEPRGADAVLLSPVLRERKGNLPLGILAIGAARSVAQKAKIYALGGVDADGARQCVDAGFDGVAVIGAVLSSPDPLRIVSALGIHRGG
jgi:thiamine-phosphate pyrophosphorylase